MYWPPYSPDWSPIEPGWSKLQTYWRGTRRWLVPLTGQRRRMQAAGSPLQRCLTLIIGKPLWLATMPQEGLIRLRQKTA